MKEFFFAFFIISIIVSCKQNNRSNSVDETEEETESSKPETNTAQQIIFRDDLVAEWPKELEKFSKQEKFQIEKELVENRHVKGVTDTIKKFTYRETSIKVYHTEGLYAVESADINNQGINLRGPVRIGLEKSRLEEVVDSEINK